MFKLLKSVKSERYLLRRPKKKIRIIESCEKFTYDNDLILIEKNKLNVYCKWLKENI